MIYFCPDFYMYYRTQRRKDAEEYVREGKMPISVRFALSKIKALRFCASAFHPVFHEPILLL